MPVCIKCGGHASRQRRGPLRKLLSRASFRCDHCNAKFSYYRPVLTAFQRYARCPLCSNRDLAVRSSFDKIDRVSHNPLRRLLLGSTIYHCTFCRYQFRDWRRLDPARDQRAKSAAAD